VTSTPATGDRVRVIDTGLPPERYARGWHCLGLVRDFADGKPHQISAFGTELVVFAGEDGKINVLNAFCPHMGGNLAHGTVKGDTIACPFHDWRWRGDGKCTAIPYARRVPPLARTKAWPTMEISGQLFIWNDPQGRKPPAELTIPEIPTFGDPGWTDWVWNSILVEDSHCREIVDNVVDMAHFFYVHYSFPTYFKNVFENQVATQYQNGLGREDARPAQSTGAPLLLGNTSVASYHGPSFMIDDLTYHYEDGDVDSVLINCHYPITENSFALQYGIIVEKAAHLDDPETIARKMGDFIKLGFEQDVAIWKNKTRIDNPLLCEEDGPVYQLRRWYEQFYVDAAEVTDEMTQRFEYEIDTSRPNEVWRAEVESNLAARESTAATAD
jgi:3-ketosteroid 9alpha-monooxygenase subunit A